MAGGTEVELRPSDIEGADRPSSAGRWPQLALLGVAVAFAAVHLTIFPLDSNLSWDEAVYLSQVTPGEPAVFFHEHRSRGMVLLLAPIAWLGPPMMILRLWVVLVMAAGVYASFRVWVDVIGAAAPLAAGLFVSKWSALYFSATLYPNFPAALALIAGTGAVVRAATAPGPVARRQATTWAAIAFLVAALLRPSDAGLLGLGIAVVAVALWQRRALAGVAGAALGGAVGLGVWFVEGAVRFGLSPLGLMFGALERSTGGPSPNQLPLYLANLEGPLRCRAECRAAYLAEPGWVGVPPRAAAWLVALGVAVAVGAVLARGSSRRTLAVLAGAAAPLLWFYARSGSAVNQRYLLPVLGVVCLGAAIGVVALVGRFPVRARLLAGLCAALLVLPWVGYQFGLAAEEMDASQQHRDRARELGRIIADRADGEPCAFASSASYPQIQHWSGCLGVELPSYAAVQAPLGSWHSMYDLRVLAQQGVRIFAVSQRELPEGSPLAGWPSERIDSELLGRYELYELPRDGSILPPDPRP